MQALLRSMVRSGTGRGTFLGRLEGGKTGATNESRDLLFIDYKPSRKWAMGIFWLGNDDNSPTRSSSALAAFCGLLSSERRGTEAVERAES